MAECGVELANGFRTHKKALTVVWLNMKVADLNG